MAEWGMFDTSGVSLWSANLVMDIGSGPNLYPAMVLAPYVSDGGAIDLIEYGTSNRLYIKATMLESPQERPASIWTKFRDVDA